MIDVNGQVGTLASSRRFKQDIREMGDASTALLKLRPVTFNYRQQPAAAREYGLIAEEVAEVAPDLVIYDKDGEAQTVQYHKINAMLLNEVQKQNREIQQQNAHIQSLENRITALAALLQSRPQNTSAEGH